MPDRHGVTQNYQSSKLPDDVKDPVNTIISGIMALATKASNWNRDLDSSGSSLIFPENCILS